MLTVLFISLLSPPLTAQATTLVKGIFLNVSYEEVILEDNKSEKQLSKLTLINDKGKTITLNIDEYASLFINSTPTSIGAFKEGMLVEATVDLRNVKELNGFSHIEQGNSNAIGESLTGTVNIIDTNGRFITINLKDRKPEKYYLDSRTQVFKDNKLVDLSSLYEGDRVKLKLSNYDSKTLSTIEIITEGIKIDYLYKGTIQQVDVKQKKLVVKDEKFFQNWNWQPISVTTGNLTSKSFSSKTPIYVGNKKVDSSQLRNYINNEVYYVTIKQFGEDVVQKIIIKQAYERNLHESLISVDTTTQNIRLSNTGNIPYHNGTIIIRNGRLVDPSALSQSGNAYVITSGVSTHQYANVIHITNNGFQSDNLSNHEVYFGEISSVGNYQLHITNASKLINNYWYSTPYTNLNFSNDTFVIEDYNNLTKDFTHSTSKYAYFYVKDNHVVAARIIGYGSPAHLISVGRYQINGNSNYINLKDVNQWNNGSWINANPLYNLNVSQATFIRDGKVISVSNLKENDRLYIIHDSYSNARIILVD